MRKPILDGSAKVFIEKIIKAEIEISESPIKVIKLIKKFIIKMRKTHINQAINFKPDIDFEIK